MKKNFSPFILSIMIVLADQFTKWLIVVNVPYHTVGWRFGGDLFRIIHIRNLAVAFSLGHSFPSPVKLALFIVVPIAALIAISVYLAKSDELTTLQRWALAAVVGGGVGNIIDRIFRPAGVVDFLDVKFFGIFGLERWPTFNLADSSVVVAGLILIISFILESRKQ